MHCRAVQRLKSATGQTSAGTRSGRCWWWGMLVFWRSCGSGNVRWRRARRARMGETSMSRRRATSLTM